MARQPDYSDNPIAYLGQTEFSAPELAAIKEAIAELLLELISDKAIDHAVVLCEVLLDGSQPKPIGHD